TDQFPKVFDKTVFEKKGRTKKLDNKILQCTLLLLNNFLSAGVAEVTLQQGVAIQAAIVIFHYRVYRFCLLLIKSEKYLIASQMFSNRKFVLTSYHILFDKACCSFVDLFKSRIFLQTRYVEAA